MNSVLPTVDSGGWRWIIPRYSLRTLLIIVTLIGCWLGYQLKWIRDRRQFLQDQDVILNAHDVGPAGELAGDKKPRPPGMLWMFSEPGYKFVNVWVNSHDFDNLSAADHKSIEEALHLFPESVHCIVTRWSGGYHRESLEPVPGP
jgi:hypothetical protein